VNIKGPLWEEGTFLEKFLERETSQEGKGKRGKKRVEQKRKLIFEKNEIRQQG
jgi:hypothetical protein